MKIGVVSDTHDHLETAREAVEFFEREVDVVIHCGDMVAPFTAKIFDSDSFDFYCVRGNNDGEWDLKGTVEEFGDFFNNTAELEFEGRKIAVYHGTEEEIADALLGCGEYDYVFRGHTHTKKLRESGDTVEVNPGGIPVPWDSEALHVAVLDLETGEIEFHGVG